MDPIGFALKLVGLGDLWDRFRSVSAEIGAAGLILAGAGMMLSGLGGLVAELVACAAPSCALGLARGLKQDPDFALIMKGLITFKMGLLGLGFNQKIGATAAAVGAGPAPKTPAADIQPQPGA
jgi:hypothetical protein